MLSIVASQLKISMRHETNSVCYGSSDTCMMASSESFKFELPFYRCVE